MNDSLFDSKYAGEQDLDSRTQSFMDDSRRLFSDTRIDLTLYKITNTNDFRTQRATDLASVNELLQMGSCDFKTVFYIMQQENSWSTFNITEDVCRKVLTSLNVFPAFLDCLHSFGSKTDEDNHVWDGFQGRIERTAQDPSFEICYNFRYIDRKICGNQTRWVLRQTGIYHRGNIFRGSSKWILMQPPQRFTPLLQKLLGMSSSNTKMSSENPLQLHSLLVSMVLDEVPNYIESIQKEVTQLNHKACFSTIGTTKAHDFTVAFSDVQKLQLLRHKCSTLSGSLRGLQAIVRHIRSHGVTLNRVRNATVTQEALYDFKMRESRIQTGIFRLSGLTEAMDGISSLLSSIVQLRHDEILLRNSTVMQKSLELLRQIGNDSQQENRNLSQIAEQNHKDSRAVKSLTVIATMYLPASLIATIFSSSLVQTPASNEVDRNRTYFKLSPQFWVYILLSISLMIVTFIGMSLLQCHYRTKPSKAKRGAP